MDYFDEENGKPVKSVTAAVKTEPMDSEWRKRLDDVLLPEFEKRPDLLALRNKLLSFGGEEANVRDMENPPAEVSRLMQRGQYWSGKATFKKMQHNNCHGNSVCLMKEGIGEVVNGYALSKDGLWRPHSWLVTPEGGLIETTVRRAAYFGAVLNLQEVQNEYGRTFNVLTLNCCHRTAMEQSNESNR